MSCQTSGEFPPTEQWVYDGGFLLILVGLGVMIWGMAFICEEYSVPAITVFCKRNNFSDDVAGAIFIGTGLSLPVLFASFVGLFVENSSIGVGTVVGGNIFNHFINVVCGIMAAPGQTLKLDRVVFARENVFYVLSCILVIWSVDSNLSDALAKAFDRATWEKCVSISLSPALVLVGNYVLYCVVEVYFQSWCDYISTFYQRWKAQHLNRAELAISGRESPPPVSHGQVDTSSSVGDDDVELLRQTSEALADVRRRSNSHSSSIVNTNNNATLDNYHIVRRVTTNASRLVQDVPREDDGYTQYPGISDQDIEISQIDDGGHIIDLPSLPDAIQESGNNRIDELLHEFPMFMRSSFYSTYDIGCMPSSRKWNLRYFTYNEHGLFYKLEFHLPMRGAHLRFIDVFDLERIQSANRDMLEFSVSLRSSRKVYFFRCSDIAIYEAVLAKLTSFLEEIKIRSDSELRAMSMKSVYEMLGVDDAIDADSESIEDTMFVVPSVWWRKVIYYCTLPLKYLIFFTTPDVRCPGNEHKAIRSILIGFTWLAATTFVLIKGLNTLANALHVSGAVLGITVGAWAASYPAAWSTIVVARYGYGDMVLCNALGSNVFSNFLGLGLPWLVYIAVYQKSYSNIQDQGVTMSVLSLIFAAIFFYALVAWNNYVLEKWMVPILVIVYGVYVCYFTYFIATF